MFQRAMGQPGPRHAPADQLLHTLIANASAAGSQLREVEFRNSANAAPLAKAVLDDHGLLVDTRYGDPRYMQGRWRCVSMSRAWEPFCGSASI